MVKLTSIAFSLLLLACAPGAQAAGKGELRVVLMDSDVYDFPLVFAEKEGYFKREGLTVKKITVQKGPHAILMAGRAELVIGNAAAVMSASENGGDLKIIAALFPRFDFFGVSRYKPEEGARIKTAAFNSMGAASAVIMAPFLDRFGVDQAALKKVYAAGDMPRYSMLEMGYADLTLISSPEILTRISAEKKYYCLPITALPEAEPAVLTTSEKAMKKRGGEIGKFVSAIYKAIGAAAADRGKAIALLQSEYKYSPEVASIFYETFAGAARGMRYVPSADRFKASAEQVKADRGAEPARPSGTLIYTEYAQNAVKAQGKTAP